MNISFRFGVCGLVFLAIGNPLVAEPLSGTKPLDTKDDLALQMVAGIDRYLMRELANAAQQRKGLWKPDRTSLATFHKSIAPNRERLQKNLGIVDPRVPAQLEYVGGPAEPSLVAETARYRVHAVRWATLAGVDAEGLLLEPKEKVAVNVVALPDADHLPEQLAGLAPGLEPHDQFARLLAENGCRVLVPTLINRMDELSGSKKFNRWTNQPHREFIYRMAYEMGRHILGYEVQKVSAAVDWFNRHDAKTPIAVWGEGEGAVVAALSTAVDLRIKCVVQTKFLLTDAQPLYRNVWAYQAECGDEGLRTLCQDRLRIVEVTPHPPIVHPKVRDGRGGAAPLGGVSGLQTAFSLEDKNDDKANIGDGDYMRVANAPNTLMAFCRAMQLPEPAKHLTPLVDARKNFRPEARQQRQFDQLVAFSQRVWRDSEAPRLARFAKVDFSSPAKYEQSVEPIRQFFDTEVIGKLPTPTLPMNPQTRPLYDTPKWTGYEVTLDLYPDVFAYGILLLPKDMKPNEKRPVVVCQHGLEGRPQDVCNPKERTRYYNSFGAQLADLGYIVYAPQNPYIGQDKFRVLQRKANPLKLSLFSFIVRQHERTLDWLSTLPNVDASKLAFYGLSYGGKTAMRVPALVPKYCLSICSGDFNEWVGKNVSVDYRGSYMFTMEYEMPEFDLGMTFNYAEMAYLIAPRPFMVERGHDDGVGIDEMVAYEYAKVRYWYENRLKLGARQELEFFIGGHEIHGQGTFAFLKKHLGNPK